MGNHSIRVAKLSKEKGNVAFEAKDYATARSLYSHAIALDRSNYLYPLNRSMANLKLVRWDEAEADATKSLELSPRNLKGLFRRGKARTELGKWDRAREDIQMFIDNGGDPTLGAQELKAIADAKSSPPSEPSSYTPSDIDSGLANLHLQDDSSFFAIHASATVQNGKGAFATRDIQRGDLILSERPMICVPTRTPECVRVEAAVRALSPAHLDSYLSLHNAHTECSCYPNPLFGIFGTNAFTVGAADNDSGICLRASRFNHSCSPNARHAFNSNTGELQIYALGTIRRGEEIFLAYIGSRCIYGSPRLSRQAILLRRYHFTCACSVCSLPEAESKMSDARRQKVNELWEIARRHIPTQGDHCLNVVDEAMGLLRKEGYMEDAKDFLNEAGPMSPT